MELGRRGHSVNIPETLAGQNWEAEQFLPDCCLLRGLTSLRRRPDLTKLLSTPNSVSDTVTSSLDLNHTAAPQAR